MFLAISRFKVKNGMQQAVQQAFVNRPQQVESIPGFLDMEVYSPLDDDSEFWLLTRWIDEKSFQVWHGSAAHKQSQKHIPKGLKLDPTATFVRHFEKVSD